MENCIFCKIVAGEIPCLKLYEDEHCLAFLDIHPAVKGHSLVIPKKHFADWLSTPVVVLGEIARVSKIVAEASMTGLRADGFNIEINTKPAAGQVIGHTHLHILPRYANDGLKLWPSQEATMEELKTMAASLVKVIE